mmetsp:Transcript_6077/g.37674  ORF Transcript_6077/g.37674 Transcript_6077/m.37674 type:complete len:219 (+) Transcript_6077:116-772(+)
MTGVESMRRSFRNPMGMEPLASEGCNKFISHSWASAPAEKTADCSPDTGAHDIIGHAGHLLFGIFAAFPVPHDVGRSQHDGHDGDQQVIEVELDAGNDGKEGPSRRCRKKPGPEPGGFLLVDGTLVHVRRFKLPFARSIFFDFVPPSQSDQEPSCDVLDHPEIHGQKNNADHEVDHKSHPKQSAEDVVSHRSRLEGHVARTSDRMRLCARVHRVHSHA